MTDILIAEDDPNIREWVSVALEHSTCHVRAVADGAAALKAWAEKRPSLIILDVMMPKVSGWDVVSEIRKTDKLVPVLMLSARSAEVDKVTGLELGADDYLTKPFGVAELRARVAALLRRASAASLAKPGGDEFKIGSLTVEAASSALVAANGERTELTPLELGILRFLNAHRGEVVSRENLLAGLWGVAYTGTTRTIDTRIGRLRQKMGEAGALIETVYGTGYRLRTS